MIVPIHGLTSQQHIASHPWDDDAKIRKRNGNAKRKGRLFTLAG